MTSTQAIDLDMLAVDLGDMLAKYGYLDACDDDIRPHLDEFVAKIQASIASRPADEPANSEPSTDAASWSPEPDQAEAALAYQPPKYGRVRVYPIYIFAATDPTDPEIDEVWITDWEKNGEAAARREALTEAAKHGGTLGRLLRKDTFRWLPYVGTPRDARPW